MQRRSLYRNKLNVMNQEQLYQELLRCLEQGNQYGEIGQVNQAIDNYVKGLQLSRELNDQVRIKQFTNLILTII
jgi:hypothetical protein